MLLCAKLEIIGEAANNLSDDFKKNIPKFRFAKWQICAMS